MRIAARMSDPSARAQTRKFARRARLDPKRRFMGGTAFVGSETCAALLPCQRHFRRRLRAQPPHDAEPPSRERGRRRRARAAQAKPTSPRARESGGAPCIKHARYYWLLLAESHLTRRLFGSMVLRIAALAVPTG